MKFNLYQLSVSVQNRIVNFGLGNLCDAIKQKMRHLLMFIVVVMGMDVISGDHCHSLDIVSNQNFGKHCLCETEKQRQMFQRAILHEVCLSSDKKKNACVENDVFMLFVDQTLCKETGVKHSLMPLMVETLCKDTGGWLEKWVREYVDYDINGDINHGEKEMFHRYTENISKQLLN